MIEVQHLLGFKEKFILFRIYLCQSNVSPPIFPVRPKLKFNTNEKKYQFRNQLWKSDFFASKKNKIVMSNFDESYFRCEVMSFG